MEVLEFTAEKFQRMFESNVALLGMSRVQISREISKLKNRQLISTSRGKIIVTDLPALAALCSSETL